MRKVKIFGDSTCDLPKDLLDKYEIGVMNLPVFIGDRQCRDGIDATPEDIYNYYETTGKMCRTSAPNANDYIELWKPWIDDGYDVIHFISVPIFQEPIIRHGWRLRSWAMHGPWIPEFYPQESVC